MFNKFNMNDYNPRKTPFLSEVKLEEVHSTPLVNNTLYRQLVGCLSYLNHTRPGISYVVSVESTHKGETHDIHWRVEKIIFHFVQGTRTHGIHYVTKYHLELFGFTDFDWEGDNADRKSTPGYVFMLSYGMIICSCKMKSSIAVSSTKEEYSGAVNEATQCLWL